MPVTLRALAEHLPPMWLVQEILGVACTGAPFAHSPIKQGRNLERHLTSDHALWALGKQTPAGKIHTAGRYLDWVSARISSNCRNLEVMSMNETQYLQKIEEAFEWVESQVDHWSAHYDLDLESKRMGSVLEVEFESGQKIILNAQAPTQQLWLASVQGAHHFVWQPEHQDWLDTRGHGLFPQVLLSHAQSIAGLSGLAFLEE